MVATSTHQVRQNVELEVPRDVSQRWERSSGRGVVPMREAMSLDALIDSASNLAELEDAAEEVEWQIAEAALSPMEEEHLKRLMHVRMLSLVSGRALRRV